MSDMMNYAYIDAVIVDKLPTMNYRPTWNTRSSDTVYDSNDTPPPSHDTTGPWNNTEFHKTLLYSPPIGGSIKCCTMSARLSVRPSHACDLLEMGKPRKLL